MTTSIHPLKRNRHHLRSDAVDNRKFASRQPILSSNKLLGVRQAQKTEAVGDREVVVLSKLLLHPLQFPCSKRTATLYPSLAL
jgi:hypothetical protein